jgi:disulfide bond formation protein DsbB
MADVMSGLSKPAQPNCDEVAFAVMGVSLAGYNVIASLALAAGSLYAALRKDWWPAS